MSADADGAAIREVLDFWFGVPPVDWREDWFNQSNALDEAIRRSFKARVAEAAEGVYDEWLKTGDGCLALTLLLDQFPRNLFRGTARAFAADPMARAVARHVLAKKLDEGRRPVERLFLYLPFEHSEDLKDQDVSVDLMMRLANPDWLDYAVKHRDVIRKFGRFPHRNAALGRAPTDAEVKFLRLPGSSF